MTSTPRGATPAVNAWNPDYLEHQYEAYRKDPASVPEDLRSFFRGFELGLERSAPPSGEAPADGRFQHGVTNLIARYRSIGHLGAHLDPFGRPAPRPEPLSLAFHGLTEQDLARQVHTGSVNVPDTLALGQLIEFLEGTYCGTVGIEVMHIQDPEERRWLLDRVERDRARVPLDRGRRAHILEQLIRAEEFERFLGRRYPGEKRFSLEGAETLIPLLDHLLEEATNLGVEEIVMGMAHRGRLNVLNNVLNKSYEQIFTEFEDNWEEDWALGGGDVKYHRGYSGERAFRNGKTMRVAMASNPSHLEAVDPVVCGRCRAKQRLRADDERRRVIPVLIHGDAAIAGQGVVAELLNLSQLEGYTTGGTVHVVINNLIGFTTAPKDGRSSHYCTDMAKAIDAPVFHVNGEDPEAAVAVAQFAIEYRQRFRKDVFIDMYCYRRYGHNEQDEASFTQPLLYALIRNSPGVLKTYAERLLAEGIISEGDMRAIRERLEGALDKAQTAAKETPFDPTIDPGSLRWDGMRREYSHDPIDTSVPLETLAEVAAAMGRAPEGFNLNPKLKKLLSERATLAEHGRVSYADAEMLAFGTLLLEGTAVRVSGQDSRRGTFSSRHAVLCDVETAATYTPLNHMREVGRPGTDRPPLSIAPDGRPRQARFSIYDSPLSEVSVLGFEYGYSLADPGQLICWEAQFGDFANGAQVVIDQFIASAEIKWERWSGLVLLLPHGYEGMGPEHSSARLERFLQLCGDDNMQVTNPTTAAQIFHLLRRQARRTFRKPLIVMAPKSLLRVPTSTIDEFTSGRFQEVMDDPVFVSGGRPRDRVRRVLLCSGKIAHELMERRESLGRDDVAIVRFEQLFPLHERAAREIIGKYPAGAEHVWVQEEPRNMGAYVFMSDALSARLGLTDIGYIGREASASSAPGSKALHKVQQEQILAHAFGPLTNAAVRGRGLADAPVEAQQRSPANARSPRNSAKAVTKA